MFGAGMIMTRGCASRLLVLSANGNLRALLSGLSSQLRPNQPCPALCLRFAQKFPRGGPLKGEPAVTYLPSWAGATQQDLSWA